MQHNIRKRQMGHWSWQEEYQKDFTEDDHNLKIGMRSCQLPYMHKTSTRVSTGVTPYSLFYVMEVVLPVEVAILFLCILIE